MAIPTARSVLALCLALVITLSGAQAEEPVDAAAAARAAADRVPTSWMTTPTPLRDDWMKRHEEYVRIAQAGGVDVLFLGDSITDFWRGNGRDLWKEHLVPLKSANFGISGDGTHNLLWRIQNGELEVLKPKVVVLLIGTNNIPWTFEKASTAAVAKMVVEAVELLIRTIQAKQPQAKILLLGILPRGEKPNPSREAIRLVNRALEKHGKGIRWLNFGDRFLEGDTLPASLMPDFVHPSARGYAIWIDAMMPVLRELLLAANPGN